MEQGGHGERDRRLAGYIAAAHRKPEPEITGQWDSSLVTSDLLSLVRFYLLKVLQSCPKPSVWGTSVYYVGLFFIFKNNIFINFLLCLIFYRL